MGVLTKRLLKTTKMANESEMLMPPIESHILLTISRWGLKIYISYGAIRTEFLKGNLRIT